MAVVELPARADVERRARFHALKVDEARALADVEEYSRQLLRVRREELTGQAGWLPASIREDLAKAINRLDVTRALLVRHQAPAPGGEDAGA